MLYRIVIPQNRIIIQEDCVSSSRLKRRSASSHILIIIQSSGVSLCCFPPFLDPRQYVPEYVLHYLESNSYTKHIRVYILAILFSRTERNEQGYFTAGLLQTKLLLQLHTPTRNATFIVTSSSINYIYSSCVGVAVALTAVLKFPNKRPCRFAETRKLPCT